MRIPSARREPSTDWVLQFINIVFLILLFFMVNGTIASPPPADVVPPVSILSETANPPQLALFVGQDGRLTYLGQPTSLDAFAELAARTRGGAEAPRAIVADRRLPAKVLIDLLAELQARGLPALPLVTLKQEP